ncbi:electron transfer flavoprotein subunit alpha/FixB family protein [Effusibacillus lacus]|uniref:Electron transfer flavoprotein subunit alpha n=1 Tax=Effusibacillus lacus TaxID=1348429 RepID=A0A292YS05_9BACL|nr:electron transfer flavoprotein subunit alpha/FixB family protein [Effusibacillus lacus]TCS75902.1 electron transfer flavoprotein alpha subunit apoprotein [Effusibacillus lacus]GAX91709.1 electron transfer flavoprotein subunit alpha [Effusibacillus lacus]
MNCFRILLFCSDRAKLPNLMQACKNMADKVHPASIMLLVAGVDAKVTALQLLESGVDEIIAVEIQEETVFSETISAILEQVIRKYNIQILLMLHTPFETEVAARVSTKLDAGCITNCLSISGDTDTLFAEKMLYGGVVTGTYAMKYPAVCTLHENICRDKWSGIVQQQAKVLIEDAEPRTVRKKVVQRRPIEKAVDLKNAERIVAIGRGLSKKEDLPLVEELSKALSAQLGCSRPLVEDYKWLKLERQVGLTGTTVAPKLYLAIGISGQIQHVVGIKDAQVVVAINNNKNAPIFEVADYGIVGDLYEAIPHLKELAQTRTY